MIDLKGQRFGFWIVLHYYGKNRSGQTQWFCQCECGKQKPVTSNSLRTGNSTSCGCNHVPDLTNQRFGNLLVLKIHHVNGRRYWLCQCDCGNDNIIVSTYKLRKYNCVLCKCYSA